MLKNSSQEGFKIIRKPEIIFVLAGLILLTISFFLIPVLFTPDSVEYYEYTKIFKGKEPISSWNVVRGPTFPIILYWGTRLFGESVLGILLTTYIFFMVCIYFSYKFLFEFLRIAKLKKFYFYSVIILTISLILLNPILFGYFHTYLTELVAIPIGMLSYYLCWKWISIDVSKQIKLYFLFNFIFVFLFIFLWFLKQPYVSLILFPLVVSVLISVIKNSNFRNIILRTFTLFSCVFLLFSSIVQWKIFLTKNGVDYDGGQSSEDFLASSIMNGLSNIRFEKINDFDEVGEVTSEIFFSTDEREKLVSVITSDKITRYKVVKILAPSGNIVDRVVLYENGLDVPIGEYLNLWVKVLIEYPKSFIDSYYANYLATINIFTSQRDPDMNLYYPIKEITEKSHENSSIGLNYLDDNDNFKWIDSYNFPKISEFFSNNFISSNVKNILKPYSEFHLYLFKLFFLLLPVFSIISVVQFFTSLKSTELEQDKTILILMLIIPSLLHLLAHVLTGAIIDRYAFVVFPQTVFGIIFILFGNQKYSIKNEH